MAQTFFLLDGDTGQPVCFSLSSWAQSVAQATPPLLNMAAQILGANPHAATKPRVLCDKEHYCQEVFADVRHQGAFDLLCALSAYQNCRQRWQKVPETAFTAHWPGYAISIQPCHFHNQAQDLYYEDVQREGVRKKDYQYKGFLSAAQLPQVPALTRAYPQRWHVEEFFKFNQALGWHRAGTRNLHIRYGHLSRHPLALGLRARFPFQGGRHEPQIRSSGSYASGKMLKSEGVL